VPTLLVMMSASRLLNLPTALEPWILQLTLPLPTGPRHVHSYFLRVDDCWLLVDTGLRRFKATMEAGSPALNGTDVTQ